MSRPELKTDRDLIPGLAAVALFVVLTAAFLTANVGSPAGFGEGAAVMKSLGAALFGIEASRLVSDAAVPSEGFLVAFEIIDVVLVAALVGSIMLARREVAGENVTVGAASGDADESGPATATDGGEPDEPDRSSSDHRSDRSGGEA